MKCKKCNDTGIWETGNNDLPCDCPMGDSALFNMCGVTGPVTGKEMRKHFLNGCPDPIKTGKKKIRADVKPKAPGNAGQWLCVTCGEPFANNLEAHFHSGKHPKHKFAWRNFETGDIEEP